MPATPQLILICLLSFGGGVQPFAITGRLCQQNVSIKYQETIVHNPQPTRRSVFALGNKVDAGGANSIAVAVSKNESYVTYEPRVRFETKTVCCPGYRTLILGLCEAVCEPACSDNSICITPNQCRCLPGYEEHHPNRKQDHLIDCRPTCPNGCPAHSNCVARSRCKCRDGYKDTSGWLTPMKCERIRCSALDQRYDAERHACVKIEMSMEDLMKKVGARLTKGLSKYALPDGEDGDEDDEQRINENVGEENDIVKAQRMVETMNEGRRNT